MERERNKKSLSETQRGTCILKWEHSETEAARKETPRETCREGQASLSCEGIGPRSVGKLGR